MSIEEFFLKQLPKVLSQVLGGAVVAIVIVAVLCSVLQFISNKSKKKLV